MHNGYFSIVKKMLFKYLNIINEEGLLPNRSPPTELAAIDSVGWLFKRVHDFIFAIDNMGITKKFLSSKEKKQITNILKETIEKLITSRSEGWLFESKAQETWMDTSFKKDDRSGFRIEIQALILFMFKLYRKLVGEQHEFEADFRKSVIQKFWDGHILHDGVNDNTVRPNLFIAAYIYPELLSREEWSKCFETALLRLWLEWGGLSSIDKYSKLFTPDHTGQNVKSYHRGDSWFWINNLAALVMHRVDKVKFKRYIDAIIKASVEEMLYKGITGFQSELSSASELKSEGCLAQTWSNAMFVELIDEIYP